MTSFVDLSDQQLNSLLRRASNQLEILGNPEGEHQAAEEERLRIISLTEAERLTLRNEALSTIQSVRTEFRRRSRAS